MAISGAKAKEYMKEWMNLRAIKKVSEDEKFLFFEAKDVTDNVQSYRIGKQLDSENQYNVEIDDGVGYGWCDAIPAGSDFEASKMERFIKSQSLLAMVLKDLSAKNPKLAKEDILETIFNSYVLDDSVMVRDYSKA